MISFLMGSLNIISSDNVKILYSVTHHHRYCLVKNHHPDIIVGRASALTYFCGLLYCLNTVGIDLLIFLNIAF